MSTFEFSVSPEEQHYLRELVQQSILTRLENREDSIPEPPTDRMRESLGAFVTLKKQGHLRGCIGNVQGSGPLFRTVWNMARAAAFEDPRFPPLSRAEFDELSLEISILSPISECPDVNRIEVGRHGLIMSDGMRSGLLLPQVPVEWQWDRETFLTQTCNKAGLPPDAWKEPSTTILWFEAVVF